ncbi:MAG: hypothetical protein ABIH49_02995 [archaeon]
MIETNYLRTLVDYFKKNLVKGYPAESLKFALINQGYTRTDIAKALEQANRELSARAPVVKEKPKIKYEIYDADNKPFQLSPKKPLWKNFFFWMK